MILPEGLKCFGPDCNPICQNCTQKRWYKQPEGRKALCCCLAEPANLSFGLMKVGVFSVILGSLKLEKALDYFATLGVQSVELGAGAFAGQSHCPVDALLKSPQKVKDFL